MIGSKRNEVMLCPHEKEWEIEAQRTINKLKGILGSVAKDIQHVGSTSIHSIKAKPIIDIAIAVDDFKNVLNLTQELLENGFYYRPNANENEQLLFACGSLYDGTGEVQTHFIHVVLDNSKEWVDYINFRDYLNKNLGLAKEYEQLKISLAEKLPKDNCRELYTEGKNKFITFILRKALVKSYLGKTVTIGIDRPIGYVHHKEKYTLTYQINYGYIPGVLGGDGEELDVYLLGVDEPVEEYTATIIGIAHRLNDVEDKLIAAPKGVHFTKEEIKKAVEFQEKWYDTEIEVLNI